MKNQPGMGHNNPVVNITSLSKDELKKLKGSIKEMDDSFTRVSAERELQKDIIDKINGELGVDKKLLRRIARAYHKANFIDEKEANSNFEDGYNAIDAVV